MMWSSMRRIRESLSAPVPMPQGNESFVTVNFAAHPLEAKKYIEELEAYWEEEEQRQEEQADNLIKYVHSMKKSDLQEALLQLLFDGPEWQYDRFIEENL